MKNEFYNPDFWEKKQGDGSSDPFKPDGTAKFNPNAPKIDLGKSKDTTTTKGEKGKKVGKILDGAATAVKQFTQSQKVDYSSINKSSRGNVGESDLTQPGYSDYFARDNNGPV